MLKQIRIPFIITGIAALAIGIVFALQSRTKPPKPTPTTPLTMPASVRSIDHMWGEPAKAMFPDIERPVYVGAKEADLFLRNDDPVMDVVYGQTHYIYPINILSFHHIVNDTIDGKPVAVTFCLLSDSALVFSRQIGDTILDLGVLGPLYFGNLVMYDKKTDSYIIQMTGEIFHGPLSGKTLRIEAEPAIVAWKYAKEGNVKVLSPAKPIAFYRDFYDTRKSSQMGLQSLTQKGGKPDARLDPYIKGIGLTSGGETAFIPVQQVKEKRAVSLVVGSQKVMVSDDTQSGSITVTGGTRLAYTPAYWFSWSAFYPQTKIVE